MLGEAEVAGVHAGDGYPELEPKLGRFMVGRAPARRGSAYLAAAREGEEGDRLRGDPRAPGTTL